MQLVLVLLKPICLTLVASTPCFLTPVGCGGTGAIVLLPKVGCLHPWRQPLSPVGCEELLEGIRKNGYSKPTPIQSQACPAGLSGRDVIGIAARIERTRGQPVGDGSRESRDVV